MKNRTIEVDKIFRALGDRHRIHILDLLMEQEMNAGELLEKVDVVQSTLSHHMKSLCQSGLVFARKEGKWTYYSVDSQIVEEARAYLKRYLSEENRAEEMQETVQTEIKEETVCPSETEENEEVKQTAKSGKTEKAKSSKAGTEKLKTDKSKAEEMKENETREEVLHEDIFGIEPQEKEGKNTEGEISTGESREKNSETGISLYASMKSSGRQKSEKGKKEKKETEKKKNPDKKKDPEKRKDAEKKKESGKRKEDGKDKDAEKKKEKKRDKKQGKKKTDKKQK